MAVVVYSNPKWIRDIVKTKAPGRQSIGVPFHAYIHFLNQLSVKPGNVLPSEYQGDKHITEIDKKVFVNEGDTADIVKVKSTKPKFTMASKNYQLMIAGEMITLGEKEEDPPMVSTGGLTHNCGKKSSSNKKTVNEESLWLLGKEYDGVTSEIKVPPKTKVSLISTTTLITYQVQSNDVEVSAPESLCLAVKLGTRFGHCFERSIVEITAEEFLRVLSNDGNILSSHETVSAIVQTNFNYLEEETSIKKKEETLQTKLESD